jgi:cyanophycinase
MAFCVQWRRPSRQFLLAGEAVRPEHQALVQYCPRDLEHRMAPMTDDPRGPSWSSPAAEHLGRSQGRPGELALIGGSEWTAGCESFDQELLQASGTPEILVLPTAAAYWHPDRAVATAASYFSAFGASVKACMVLRRADAEDKDNAVMVRAARFVYLAGGSVLHLRSVLKASAVWEALVEAWTGGAVVAGSSAGAMVLGDAMVDPRGGALTLGLGLLPQLAVLPHANNWPEEKTHRTVRLASNGLRIAAIDERTALVRASDGRWHQRGQGGVTIWLDGRRVGLEALAPERPGQVEGSGLPLVVPTGAGSSAPGSTGASSTGAGPTGAGPTGASSSGAGSTGAGPTGAGPTGAGPTASGLDLAGSPPAGSPPAGSPAAGTAPTP